MPELRFEGWWSGEVWPEVEGVAKDVEGVEAVEVVARGLTPRAGLRLEEAALSDAVEPLGTWDDNEAELEDAVTVSPKHAKRTVSMCN